MNKYSTINLIKRINSGEKIEDIEKEIKSEGRKASKQKGKRWGKCDSCEQLTVLESRTGLCGPCCFGESDTFNGNF